MKNFVSKMFFIFKIIFWKFRAVFRLFCNSKYYKLDTYFPEYKDRRKSSLRIFLEQLYFAIKYGDIDLFYFLFGFDIKGLNREKDYVSYAEFRVKRNFLNNRYESTPKAVLRDKFLFGLVAKSLGIPTPENIGYISNGRIFVLAENKYYDLVDWIKLVKEDVFCKLIDGECADGVFHLEINKGALFYNGEFHSIDEFLNLTRNGKYLLQKKVVQHRELSNIYPNCINTIRVETIVNKTDGTIEIFPPLLRVGTGKNSVDNWAAGGLAIGIDDNGCLRKFGFYKPGYGAKVTIHPNTQIEFEGYNIPYFKEAIDLAKSFHAHLSSMHSIGWDIAITPEGPMFIEGNDNWEISLVQATSYGLKKEFKEWFN